MYINFWYPVARSSDVVSGKPWTVRAFGLRLAVFRDAAGKAAVLADTCVHRGGSLGKGWVSDDCLVCPYHGWRYDAAGRCRQVPALGADVSPPARAKVDSYPVEERYGIVFAFLGDLPAEARPPIYDIPEFGQEGWRAAPVEVFDVAAYYERSMENGLDPAHNEFVHASQGNPKTRPDVLRHRMAVGDIPWGSKFWVPFGEQKEWAADLGPVHTVEGELGAGSGHHGPNTLVTWINFSQDWAFHQYMFELPLDESHTRIFFLNLRNCMLDPAMDGKAYEANMLAIREDVVILEALHPVRSPEGSKREIMVPGDQAVVRFREHLRQWEARGWRIDRRRLRENAGDVAYAIPCPGRRTSGNWVLEAVPLVAPGAARTGALGTGPQEEPAGGGPTRA